MNHEKIQFYKKSESLEHRYYQIPQELFTNVLYKEISCAAKILYGFLLDRLSLSSKNGWYDKEDNIFLIYTRKEVEEKLGMCDRTVTKAFRQLSNVGLTYEKRQGCNKPNLIYIGKIKHQHDMESNYFRFQKRR